MGFAMGTKSTREQLLSKEHAKRGGSGTAALTNTLDPSQYPTTPPQSNYKGGIPKIGGSEGGFIGLVVGLVVLIIVCCGAVYYLLSTRKHGGRTGNKNYPPSTKISDSKGLFTSLPFRGSRSENGGWVQQHGDEFDYHSDEDIVPNRNVAGYARARGGETQETILNHLRNWKPSAAPDAYTDPFDPDHLPESVHRQQAPLPPSISSSSQDAPFHKSYLNDSTLKQSPTSPTFEGGTKFREQF